MPRKKVPLSRTATYCEAFKIILLCPAMEMISGRMVIMMIT